MNILVTGGSSGLGRAIVERLATQPGHHVDFTYCHHVEAALELERQLPDTQASRLDFRDRDSVDEFLQLMADRQIDVLVNNAYTGTALGTHFHQTDIGDFTDAFLQNVIPTIQITQACLRGMRKRRFGKIVNVITSYVVDVPPVGFSVYASTKAYIRQLSRSICKEYGRYNITSNCILPDYMATDFGKAEEFQLEQMRLAHPLKRLLLPAEVAEVVAGVIGATQQLNGVEIPVNAAQHII